LNTLELSKNGDIKMKKEVIKLANHLDKIGHSDLADRLDMILKSAGIVDLVDDDDIITSVPSTPPGTPPGTPPSTLVEGGGGGEDTTDTEVSHDDAEVSQSNADNILQQIQEGKTASVSNRVDAMAKLISKEFSLTSSGNVHRD
jgi:hypothetical protein